MNIYRCLKCGNQYYSSADPRFLKDPRCQACGERTIAVGPHVRLGEILLQLNVVSNETIDMALQKQKGTGRLIGEILVDMDAVEQSVIDYALELQKAGRRKEHCH